MINVIKIIKKNKINIILIVIFLTVLYFFADNLVHRTEGFSWSNKTKCEYENYIKFYNPANRFNIDIMEQNASEDEIKYLLKHNKYPWKKITKDIFIDNIAKNKIISIEPNIALNENQNIYPERTILQKMGFNTKEGNFLLFGSIIPKSNDMPQNINNTAKCKADNDGNFSIEKEIYLHTDPITGYKYKKTKVKNKDIENTIPGFKFVNGVCNPCSVLNDDPKYDCPFTLNVGNDNSISPVWKILWNIDDKQY